VIINKKHKHRHQRFYSNGSNAIPSTTVFRLQMKDNLDEELSKSEWNLAEIVCEDSWAAYGIHVLKEKSSMEDIRFSDPCRKRKICSSEVGVGEKAKISRQ